jgi:hypothetical protein
VWHCVQETEALLEALGDELEDVDMDLVNKSFAIKNDAPKVQSNGSNEFFVVQVGLTYS